MIIHLDTWQKTTWEHPQCPKMRNKNFDIFWNSLFFSKFFMLFSARDKINSKFQLNETKRS
jgi:hypothetical protein